MLRFRLLLLFTLLSIGMAMADNQQSTRPMPNKSGANVKGYVLCQNKGIPDVVVSDGYNVTKTDAEGRYWLKTNLNRAEFVMLSTPRGYEVETYCNFLPKFYYRLDKDVEPKNVQQFDFHLTKVENDNYRLVVVADEHVSGRHLDLPPGSGKNHIAKVDSLQFRDDFMPRIVEYAHSLPAATKIYGLNLGDMTHSEYWFRNNTGMAEYLRLAKETPFQMYHAIGNHDHCHKFTNDYEAEAEFRNYFGPTYYSFNLGQIHYIVLDDMLYHGKNTYDRIITDQQILWLRRDLKALDPQIKQLVVAMHVPSAYNNSTWTGVVHNLVNWDDLYMLLDGYETTVLSGDWHVDQTVVINDHTTEYIHPAITGNWWYRQGLCRDGVPSGFVEYDIRGNKIVNREIVDWSRGNDRQQYKVYNKGITAFTGSAECAKDDPQGDPAIMVLFWSIAPNWTFTCREDGQITSGRGSVVRAYDPLYRSYVEHGDIPVVRYKWLAKARSRFFRYIPKDKNAVIEIIATDQLHNKVYKVTTKIED